jgi:hypothetical protein
MTWEHKKIFTCIVHYDDYTNRLAENGDTMQQL